jgi:transcriptional regulator with XRE-family HTH domain
MMKVPTPAEIRATRAALGLTQKQAGAIIGKSMRAWQNYEAPEGSTEHRSMDGALFRLFLIETKQAA